MALSERMKNAARDKAKQAFLEPRQPGERCPARHGPRGRTCERRVKRGKSGTCGNPNCLAQIG